MNFFETIFFAFWFFLPAGLANMFPIFAAHLPGLKNWNYPMDFYINFRGRPLLGSNKTIRGLIVAAVIGVFTVLAQKMIYENWSYLPQTFPVDYSTINAITLGLLLGLGAILGDAAKSLVKRQINIASGDSWFFFDQIDYIIGGIILSYFYLPLEFKYYIFVAVIYFVLHLLSTMIGYMLGLKQKSI